MAVRHTKEQREFIVRRLAAYHSPREVAAAFVVCFPGVPCTESDVLASDPRKVVVAPELWLLFKQERDRIRDDPDAAPYLDRKARVTVLSRHVDEYRNSGRLADAERVLEQIAREEAAGKVDAPAGVGAKGDVVAITRTIIDPSPPPAAEPTA